MNELDYKELLRKYMALIVHQEGIDYIDYINEHLGLNEKFSKEDIEALKELAA